MTAKKINEKRKAITSDLWISLIQDIKKGLSGGVSKWFIAFSFTIFGGVITLVGGAISFQSQFAEELIQVKANITTVEQAVRAIEDRIEDLGASDIEKRVQIEMLILYQIPSAERERLRQEAEARISDDKQLEDSTKL
jgi:DNA-binding transcriptional regulator PaaX